MMRTERALWMAAVVVVALLASERGTRAGRGANVEDRLNHLEVGLDKLQTTVREDGLRLTSIAQRQDKMDDRLATVIPDTARWLSLSPGGTIRWEPAIGGQVYLQFVKMGDGGRAPVVHFKVDPGDEVEGMLQAGEILELIDDRGSEKRTFRLTLHRVVRNGAQPTKALFSVDAERSS